MQSPYKGDTSIFGTLAKVTEPIAIAGYREKCRLDGREIQNWVEEKTISVTKNPAHTLCAYYTQPCPPVGHVITSIMWHSNGKRHMHRQSRRKSSLWLMIPARIEGSIRRGTRKLPMSFFSGNFSETCRAKFALETPGRTPVESSNHSLNRQEARPDLLHLNVTWL